MSVFYSTTFSRELLTCSGNLCFLNYLDRYSFIYIYIYYWLVSLWSNRHTMHPWGSWRREGYSAFSFDILGIISCNAVCNRVWWIQTAAKVEAFADASIYSVNVKKLGIIAKNNSDYLTLGDLCNLYCLESDMVFNDLIRLDWALFSGFSLTAQRGTKLTFDWPNIDFAPSILLVLDLSSFGSHAMRLINSLFHPTLSIPVVHRNYLHRLSVGQI